MDGVIVDSEELKAASWKHMFEKYNIPKKGDLWYLERKGISNKELWKDVVEIFHIKKNSEELWEEQMSHSLILEKKAEPIKTTLKFINSIKGIYRLAVASTNHKKIVEYNLSKMGIHDYFEFITSGFDECKNQKPAPDIYLLTAQKLNLKPSECLIIEDSSSGVESAKRAGIKCVGFTNGKINIQDLSKADLIIEDFDNLNIKNLFL